MRRGRFDNQAAGSSVRLQSTEGMLFFAAFQQDLFQAGERAVHVQTPKPRGDGYATWAIQFSSC